MGHREFTSHGVTSTKFALYIFMSATIIKSLGINEKHRTWVGCGLTKIFIHKRILKAGSYEGSPRVKVQEVKGEKLKAGCLSTSPVRGDPEAVSPGTLSRPHNDNCTSRAPLREA